MTKELEALQARNAELEDRVAKLEEAAKPAEPFVPGPRFQFDPTAGASMSPSAMREMMNAVPDSLMNEIRADSRKPNPVTASPHSQPPSQVKRGSGWQEPRPLESPPGQKHIDALVSHQDRIDKAERTYALAKAIALGRKGNE